MVAKLGFILFLIVVIASCNKNSNVDCENPDYSNCNTIEPLDGKLHIIVTKLEKNSTVPVTLYQGKFGASERIIFSETLHSVDTSVYLPLNYDYYSIATYQKDGRTIYAVDGVFFKKKWQKICDSTCWSIKGDEIDVRLK